jgi:hypothetical protein
MYWAAQQGHDGIVEILVDEEAKINTKTKVSVSSDNTVPFICPTCLQ